MSNCVLVIILQTFLLLTAPRSASVLPPEVAQCGVAKDVGHEKKKTILMGTRKLLVLKHTRMYSRMYART